MGTLKLSPADLMGILQRDGVVLLEGVLAPEALAVIRTSAPRISRWRIRAPGMSLRQPLMSAWT